MKQVFRSLPVIVLILGATLWFFGGFNFGRTVLHEEVTHQNTVTGQTERERQTVFRPGWDFLAGVVAAAAVLRIAVQFTRR